jgi:hypothetical protein
VNERTTKRGPGRKHLHRPRSRRDWLITVVFGGALLALKLTLGLGLLVALIHLLTR